MEVLRQVGLRNEPLLIWSEFIISNSERTNSTILDNLRCSICLVDKETAKTLLEKCPFCLRTSPM